MWKNNFEKVESDNQWQTHHEPPGNHSQTGGHLQTGGRPKELSLTSWNIWNFHNKKEFPREGRNVLFIIPLRIKAIEGITDFHEYLWTDVLPPWMDVFPWNIPREHPLGHPPGTPPREHPRGHSPGTFTPPTVPHCPSRKKWWALYKTKRLTERWL